MYTIAIKTYFLLFYCKIDQKILINLLFIQIIQGMGSTSGVKFEDIYM